PHQPRRCGRPPRPSRNGGGEGGKSEPGRPAAGSAADAGESLWRQIRTHWPLIVADLEREYDIRPEHLPRMGMRAFLRRLAGLSAESRFAAVVKPPEPTVEESVAFLDAI